jgi:putative endonuclease
VPGFTSRYNINRLVYYEDFSDIRSAIQREKEIKAWRRSKKVALIESRNPVWLDLSDQWFG